MNFTLPKINIKGISRLRHLAKEYYNKIFKIKYSLITLPPTTLPLPLRKNTISSIMANQIYYVLNDMVVYIVCHLERHTLSVCSFLTIFFVGGCDDLLNYVY